MTNPAPCDLLPWDSEFFRCRIARVRGNTLNPERALEIDQWGRRNRIRCLYFLSRADDPRTIQAAEEAGFALVDIRVTLERALGESEGSSHLRSPAATEIRPAKPRDLPKLQTIGRTAHSATRFFSDTNFPRGAAEEFYSTWISLEVRGRAQTVLVAASATDEAIGYISCHLDPDRREGLIGLVGVSAAFRGRGIGKSLVQAGLDWFDTQKACGVTVVTQGSNRASQRLYQRCGFVHADMQLWYHKWYPLLD